MGQIRTSNAGEKRDQQRCRRISHAIEPSGIRGASFGLHETFRERAVADRSKLAEKDFWTHALRNSRLAVGWKASRQGGQRAARPVWPEQRDAAAKADSLLRAVFRRLLEPLSLTRLVAASFLHSGPAKRSAVLTIAPS